MNDVIDSIILWRYSLLSHNAYGPSPHFSMHYEILCIIRWHFGCEAPMWDPPNGMHYEIVDCTAIGRRRQPAT